MNAMRRYLGCGPQGLLLPDELAVLASQQQARIAQANRDVAKLLMQVRNRNSSTPRQQTYRPAIRGYATKYWTAALGNQGFRVLTSGCFARSLASAEPIALLVEHRTSEKFGDTASGLQLAEDKHGVAFEFELPRSDTGHCILADVRAGRLAKVSPRYTYRKSDTEQRIIAGERVTFIHAACLQEVSLLAERPVEPSTSITIVDLATATPFRAAIRSGALLAEGAHENVIHALRQFEVATRSSARVR